MSIRRDIKNTFDNIHAPEDLVERMKQDLYQKDFHEEDDEEISGVAEAPKHRYRRVLIYIAASLALCIGCGTAVWSLRNNQNEFHPGTPVVVEPTTEETTTEDTSESKADAAYFAGEDIDRESVLD